MDSEYEVAMDPITEIILTVTGFISQVSDSVVQILVKATPGVGKASILGVVAMVVAWFWMYNEG